MALEREHLIVPVITIDEAQARRGLKLSKENFELVKHDTKSFAGFLTGWVQQALGIGRAEDDPLASMRISGDGYLIQKATLRAFGNGKTISIMQSSKSGAVRHLKSTREDMLDDIERVDVYIFGDYRRFPEIRIYPVRTVRLMRWIEANRISKSGIPITKFDKFIRENFDVEERDVELKRGPGRVANDSSPVRTVMRRR